MFVCCDVAQESAHSDMTEDCLNSNKDLQVGRSFKKFPHVWRMLLLIFAMIFGIYICFLSVKQSGMHHDGTYVISLRNKVEEISCHSSVVSEAIDGLGRHYPKPKTYNRNECACTPVQFFAILSMQRSGSGWFETLLNSHPNISSNGEIFSVKERRENLSTIVRTLDQIYNMDWSSSAAKNECTAAVGLKWMLNQGAMEYNKEIVKYFNRRGVSVIFLFRRNLLRRMISVLANAYDREAKLLNGTHKSHVHTKQEAALLATYRPLINVTFLPTNLNRIEEVTFDAVKFFNSTRHIILYYEDLIKNPKNLWDVLDFLKLPQQELSSRQVKIHTRPLSDQVQNWDEVSKKLRGTKYEMFLNDSDYA